MPVTHAMTLRLPGPVYKAAKRLARQKGVSLNQFVQDAVGEEAKRSLESRVRAGYDALTEDEATAGEVERAFAVQAEAVLDIRA